jgi:REP element-mobilizing transposase RayT
VANTYSQIYIHIVFAVKGRHNLISKDHREILQKYITGIVTKREQKLLAIYCMPDHVHILVSMKPSISISDLVRDIKAGSSGFINNQMWTKQKFWWQDGFGAFSCSQNQVKIVIDYILNQERHHKKNTFKEEYVQFLKDFNVEYDNQYLFEWID